LYITLSLFLFAGTNVAKQCRATDEEDQNGR